MSTKYYCRIDEDVVGPVDLAKVAAMRKSGKLRANNEIRKATSERWVTVAYVLDRAARKRKQRQADETEAEAATQLTNQWSTNSSIQPAPEMPALSSSQRIPGDNVDSPRPRPAWLYNEYVRAALLVNFVIIPFLVPNFGPNLTGAASFLFALFSLVVGIVVYGLICLPDVRSRQWALVGAVFTGIFGAATLIQYEELAVSLVPQELSLPTSPLWLVKLMGAAFLHLMTESEAESAAGFFQLFMSAVFSAGLCEETLKLIPVGFVIGLGFVHQASDKRNVLFLGAACGLGFGFSEGMWLTMDAGAAGGVSLSAHLIHFLGRAGGHAALTLVASALLLWMARGGKVQTPGKLILLTLVASFVIAIPHGLYDALVIHGMAGLAGLIMLTLVWLVLMASDPGRLDTQGAASSP